MGRSRTTIRGLPGLVVALGLLGATTSSRAETPRGGAAPPASTPPANTPPANAVPDRPIARPPGPGGASPKRALPAYRPGEPTTAGDVALWVPRVLLFPVYLVTEYGIRQPLGALMRATESGGWIQEIGDFFRFGPDHTIGIIPTALIDFGLRSSVGFYAFHDDFLAKKNELRVHAATGGSDWLRLTVADRIPLDDRSHLKLRFEAGTRPDQLFYGIGPRSRNESASIYGARTLDGSVLFHLEASPNLLVEAWAGARDLRFDPLPQCCDKTSIFVRSALDGTALPPGFAQGYTGLRQGVFASLDSRRPRPDPGTGLRFTATAEHGIDLRDPGNSRWIKYGGEVSGHLDLDGRNRVLSLAITTRFVDPQGSAEVPFTELVAMGGDQVMFGFLPNRLLGRSAAAAVVEYRYPIWAFLDGSARVAFGNVFGPHLDDFSPRRLRLSFDFGLRTSGSRDHAFNALIGSGTETFEDGAKLDGVRFMLGGSRTF